MKRERTEGGVTLKLGKREAVLFWSLLQGYPCLPPGHFTLSRGDPLEKAAEVGQLLEESLALRRAEVGDCFRKLLSDPTRHRQTGKGTELDLTHAELEALLQVLNDMRVGSWVQLGSPDSIDFSRDLPEEKLQHAWRMDLAGYFQAQLLGQET